MVRNEKVAEVERSSVRVRQIAEHFNLAASTVSRALNSQPGVGVEIGEKIRAYAREIGYRPTPYRRNQANSMALLFPQSAQRDREFCQRVIYAAERYASSLQKFLFVSFSDHTSDSAPLPPVLEGRRVDGVLLACHPDRELVELIHKEGLPVVAIDDNTLRTGCDCINGNPDAGSSELVSMLLETGHKSFAFFVSCREWPSINRRFSALEQALAEHGVERKALRFYEELAPNMTGGVCGIWKLLEDEAQPDALIFANDWMALGGMLELGRNGIRVPEEMSVASFDNCEFCNESAPPLTSVDLCTAQVVERAIDRLIGLIERNDRHKQEEFVQIEVASRLVWRESCRDRRS